MKSVFRYIILILSSLMLAILGFNTLPTDNLLNDIIAENPGYKIAIIAIIFVGYLIMYVITTLIMSFVYCLVFKLGTKDKENFDLKVAQRYNKASITLLIALHVLCFGLRMLTSYLFYAIVYLAIGILIVYFIVAKYRKKHDLSLNLVVALIPQFAYVIGNVVYAYFNF